MAPLGAILIVFGVVTCAQAPYFFDLLGLAITAVGVFAPLRYARFGTELSAAGVRKRLFLRRGKVFPWSPIAEIDITSTAGSHHPRLRLTSGERISLHAPSTMQGVDAEFTEKLAVLHAWWNRYGAPESPESPAS
ncbi:hypothetical protein ABGB12_26035 [Actinocorallia sp. B10E7]|uniref:hypothetical protein n=1 Tax=Actinocorallia sp. B10E7 TaxID=3153558 RepID=UPI00325CEA9D